MKKIHLILLTTVILLITLTGCAAADRIVSAGDDLIIDGDAQGNPGILKCYVFGTNYFDQKDVTVEDGKYSFKYNTKGLSNGDYILLIQHPMYDKKFNVQVTVTGDVGDLMAKVYVTEGNGQLAANPKTTSAINTRQNANAAYALVDLINLEYHDDACIIKPFTVTTPAIRILNPDSIVTEGSDFAIYGTTNLKAGTKITVEITSTGFAAVAKNAAPSSTYKVYETKVIQGFNGVNSWIISVHNPNLPAGSYRMTATATNGLSDSTVFTVTEEQMTPAQTPEPVKTTESATITPTQNPTESPTPAPASPGFGIAAILSAAAATAAFGRRL